MTKDNEQQKQENRADKRSALESAVDDFIKASKAAGFEVEDIAGDICDVVYDASEKDISLESAK